MSREIFLTELLGAHVVAGGKKIGKLTDLVIVEGSRLPGVSHLVVTRPFGFPALLVPWEKVISLDTDEIDIEAEELAKYEGTPPADAVLLADHILDKKALDVEGREVEVVYDVKMVLTDKKLYVAEADLSRYGLLRRIGLRRVADFIYGLARKIGAQTISWTYLQPLPSQISSFRGNLQLKVLKEKLAGMPSVDLADILEELDHDQRVMIFNSLDAERASDTLEEIDPHVQRAIVATLEKGKVAELIRAMTPGQAADLLSILPAPDRKTILELLGHEATVKIRAILEEQGASILNLATSKFIKVTPEETVAQATDAYRERAKGKDVVMYLYVVNPEEQLLGVIDIKELLKAEDHALLQDIMVKNIVSLKPDSSLNEAWATFRRYDFRAIPVTNPVDKLLGIILYRDVMHLRHRELE
ncbi:MAG: CBS domain-containing protein [Pseudomonadota bacterium]